MTRGQRIHLQRPTKFLLPHNGVAKHAALEEIGQNPRSHLHERRGLSEHRLLDASCSHAPRSGPREQIDMRPLDNGLLKQLSEFEFYFESTKHPAHGSEALIARSAGTLRAASPLLCSRRLLQICYWRDHA